MGWVPKDKEVSEIGQNPYLKDTRKKSTAIFREKTLTYMEIYRFLVLLIWAMLTDKRFS